jgi:hypothetical protein
MQAVAASFERALFADLDDLLGRLPHDRVAVQWDVAVEFGRLEGAFGLTLPLEHVAPGPDRALDEVPDDVRPACTSATATTATSTSRSPRRCRCRSTSSTP